MQHLLPSTTTFFAAAFGSLRWPCQIYHYTFFGGHYKLLPFAGEDAGFGILFASLLWATRSSLPSLYVLSPGQRRRQHYLT